MRWLVSIPLIWWIHSLIHTPSPYTPLFMLAPAVTLGLMWTPAVSKFLIAPLTGIFDGGHADGEEKPFYFIAEGKRRKGLYEEAVTEVQKQLAKFPGDYEGYHKLATIQMENLHDLPAAQATLEEFLALPDRASNEMVSTLHLLADWQLQYGKDTPAATETLQRIIQIFPGTQLAHAAEQRIAHMGQVDETRRVRHESKFVVKAAPRHIGLHQAPAPAAPAPAAEPLARAEELVKHLEAHPSDTEARERLAVLYAEEFQRADLARDQLEQLIALPSESPKHVAHWLNLLATIQIKQAQDLPGAEATVRRIAQLYPGGALAAVAASRLATLQAELKAGQKTAAKTLGNYEKNVGLKLLDG